jgi:hypothetical protein
VTTLKPALAFSLKRSRVHAVGMLMVSLMDSLYTQQTLHLPQTVVHLSQLILIAAT